MINIIHNHIEEVMICHKVRFNGEKYIFCTSRDGKGLYVIDKTNMKFEKIRIGGGYLDMRFRKKNISEYLHRKVDTNYWYCRHTAKTTYLGEFDYLDEQFFYMYENHKYPFDFIKPFDEFED